MTQLALVLVVIYLVVIFGVRSLLQKRRTGSTGWKGISGSSGSSEWWGGVLLAVAIALVVAASIADLIGGIAPIPQLATHTVRLAGLATTVAGMAATLWAQMAMGDSWRIGVEQREVTGLVTGGPFALVRNPIFSAMLLALVGYAILVPNLIAIAGFVLALAGIELQVRLVEEPYLLRTHGEAYRAYAARVGRFVPGLGRNLDGSRRL